MRAMDLCDLIRSLRADFFAKDRDVTLQEKRYFFMGDGSRIDKETVLIPDGPIILMFGGAVVDIPDGWQLCDGTNGCVDLTDLFVVGAGDTYNPGDTGGADTVDISHQHASGTLATDTEANHTHGAGSYSAASDTHSHTDTFSIDNDTHHHGPGTLQLGGASGGFGGAAGSDYTFADTLHWHGFTGGVTADDVHNHALSGAVQSDAHTHDVAGTSGTGGSHAHDVDSGNTAVGGDAAHDNRPSFYALCYIQRPVT